MNPADTDPVQQALAGQGCLLGAHDQLLREDTENLRMLSTNVWKLMICRVLVESMVDAPLYSPSDQSCISAPACTELVRSPCEPVGFLQAPDSSHVAKRDGDWAFSDEFFPKVNIWLVLFWVLAVLVVPAAVFDVMMHRKEDKMIKELQLLCTLEGHDDVDIDYVSVTLDVETAVPDLEVSEDRKSVRRTGTRRNLPDTGKRFTYWPCVLGSEGFTSGRHYWEVEVLMNEDWRVGVAEESVVRDGWVSVLLSNGFWTIGRDGDLLYAVNCPPSHLTASPIPGRIGIYLNYESVQCHFTLLKPSPIFTPSLGISSQGNFILSSGLGMETSG
ncbi:butyrophilin subfamily 1 member A1-like [Hypanus sabinus]|uniref:butyrophilin subfamily 1 member A1-like n=1 Tax=Hypanus sabinus TaxID=79690 RepID=UPI0028C3DDDA|nr:butyrophilin subfamily 1 member A1-like [Hypanus sabinus]